MSEVAQTKIGEKGRLVILAKLREALGLKPGDSVRLEIVDGELKISTFAGRLKRAQERVQRYTTPGKSLADELIAERRGESRREEEQYQDSKMRGMSKRG